MEHQEQADILKERSRVLTEEILEDARKKAARIISRAEKEAAAVRREAETRATAVEEELAQEAERRASAEANKVTAGSGLECKRLRLASMNAFLEGLAGEGLERLESLTGGDADRIRLDLFGSVLPAVAEGDAVLVLSPAVDPAGMYSLASSVKPGLALELRTDESLFPGEFILEEEGGRIRHRAVFRDLYELRHETCLRTMYAALSGGAS